MGYVIRGIDKALQGLCIGEKRRVIVPPHMAYGEEGVGECHTFNQKTLGMKTQTTNPHCFFMPFPPCCRRPHSWLCRVGLWHSRHWFPQPQRPRPYQSHPQAQGMQHEEWNWRFDSVSLQLLLDGRDPAVLLVSTLRCSSTALHPRDSCM